MVKLSIARFGSEKTLEYFHGDVPSVLDKLKSAKDENERQDLLYQIRKDLLPMKKVAPNPALAVRRSDVDEGSN